VDQVNGFVSQALQQPRLQNLWLHLLAQIDIVE
jgi:hypothetical protein